MSPGTFKLPAEVSSEKELLPDGTSYTLRHRELGMLGRIRVQARPEGGSYFTSEVAGDPADPSTARRSAVFAPIASAVVAHFETMSGVAPPRQPLTMPANPGSWLESELLQCKACHAWVAFLTFVPAIGDTARIEDYARQLYPSLVRWNVPAWIVGPPQESRNSKDDVADIAPVWPVRGPSMRMTRQAFNVILDCLQDGHCGPQVAAGDTNVGSTPVPGVAARSSIDDMTAGARKESPSPPNAEQWQTFAAKLQELGGRFCHAIADTRSPDQALIIALLYARAYQSFQAAVVLASKGLDGDARTVIRSCVEGAIAIAATVKDAAFVDQLVDDDLARRLTWGAFDFAAVTPGTISQYL